MADLDELASVQRWLASVILDPARIDHDSEAAAERLTIDDPCRRAERLGAYVNGYPARIFEALGETFPALKHVTGEYEFAEMTNRYRAHVPEHVYGLHEVGKNLAAFLRDDELGRRYPFAADLAELERNVQSAFHSREAKPFDPSETARWTLDVWSQAIVRFQPSVAVVRSAWPILDVWRARETPLERIDIDLRDRPQDVLVYRSGLQVVCDEIGAAQALAVSVLAAGRTLGDAVQRAAEDGLSAQSITPMFAELARKGLVIACRSAAS